MNTQSYGWRSIRLRLFLLFALVIAAVLFYAVSEVMTQWNTRGAMERGAQYSELSVQINGVVHELQKERGLSAGLIGSRGARFKGELDTQHQDTDKARAALDGWLAPTASSWMEPSRKPSRTPRRASQNCRQPAAG